MTRKRLEPKYDPVWGGTFENWSRTFVDRNWWRVCRLYGTKEDGLQECALVFVRCRNRYLYICDNGAWFMSLYKRAVHNEFNVASVRETKRRRTEREMNTGTELAMLQAPSSDANLGPLLSQVRGCSAELRAALLIMAKTPAEVLSLMLSAPTCASQKTRTARFSKTRDSFARNAIESYAKLKLEKPSQAAEALEELKVLLSQ